MLKLANENDFDLIYSFCKGSLIGTRINCYCQAYGFNKDLFNVWLNETDGEIKAVIAKFYDSITLKMKSDCEADEIMQFCNMLSFSELLCDSLTNDLAGLGSGTAKKSYVFRGKADCFNMENVGEQYYKQLYALVCENISDSFTDTKEAYLSWLSDYTYRQRRNLSRSKGFVHNDMLYSSVITSSETEDAAILSAVATSKEARGKGLGKATVLAMVNELINENKEVYVIALNESAEGFYEHIGFEYAGDIHFHRN